MIGKKDFKVSIDDLIEERNKRQLGMKKEEAQLRNAALKKDYFSRSRSHSPKAYLGCDTCKLKSVKSISKLSDCGVNKRNKGKNSPISRPKSSLTSPPKNSPNSEDYERKPKVKLTDLCDEDKKRLVLLIQELSIYADRNEQLQTELDTLIKTNQEQQSYIAQQANSFTEQKKIHLNEINQYKSRIEAIEAEMKDVICGWKNHEMKKNSEIIHLAKVLRKTLKEKKDLHDQMNNLKISLEHSLECFHKLKTEVTELQDKEREIRKFKSTSCQTVNQRKDSRGNQKPFEEETEEDYFSINNQSSVNPKSSVDVVNDTVEHMFRIIRKEDDFLQTSPRKCDLELFSNWKDDGSQKTGSKIQSVSSKTSITDEKRVEEKHTFNKHAKNILSIDRSTTEIPQDTTDDEDKQQLQNNSTAHKPKELSRDCKNFNFLQSKIVQENNFLKSPREHQCDEDRLLEELFYSEQSTSVGFYSKLKNKKWANYLSNFPK